MLLFERGISEAIFRFSSQAVFLKPLLAFSAEALPYALGAFFIIKLFMVKSVKLRYHYLFLAVLSTIIARGIITEAIGFFFKVSRPFVQLGFEPLVAHPDTASFPSGHMALLVPLALVMWKMDRRAGRWFAALTLLVGISRIFVGVHWISDIAGGIAVGVLGIWLAGMLLPKKLSGEED